MEVLPSYLLDPLSASLSCLKYLGSAFVCYSCFLDPVPQSPVTLPIYYKVTNGPCPSYNLNRPALPVHRCPELPDQHASSFLAGKELKV